MVRPKKQRFVEREPGVTYYKPRAIPLSELEEVRLSVEEFEALRLEFLEKHDYADSAKAMNVGRATFSRILHSAGEKIADALMNGKAIRIEGGAYALRGGVRNAGRNRSRKGKNAGHGNGPWR